MYFLRPSNLTTVMKAVKDSQISTQMPPPRIVDQGVIFEGVQVKIYSSQLFVDGNLLMLMLKANVFKDGMMTVLCDQLYVLDGCLSGNCFLCLRYLKQENTNCVCYSSGFLPKGHGQMH